MFGIEHGIARSGEIAVACPLADLHGQGIVRFSRTTIDQYLPLADFGEGVAILRQDQRDVGLCGKDASCHDRLPDLKRQAVFDQIGRFGLLRFDRDGAKLETFAWLDFEQRRQFEIVFVACANDPRPDRGIIPPF